MWRQQLNQHLDVKEEGRSEDFRSADQEHEEIHAVSADQLHILGLYVSILSAECDVRV